MKQRLGSDPLSWIRDTRAPQEDANTGERDGTTAAPTAPATPAPSTNDTNTGERDAASAPAAPTAPATPAPSTNDANTGERDAATAAAPAAPAASTKKTNTTERAARPAASAASTKKANTGERAARRKPAQAAQVAQAAPAAQAAQVAQAGPAAPAAPAAPANDTNTGELPGEEALRALIARELAGMTPRRGRPRTNLREVTKSSQEGLPENWTRATFIVRETLLEDLKDCAYTRRKTIRDVLDEALTAYLSGQELLRRPR